ncbi:hypothetical protein [Methylobacter sp.]|uniref:hypothetical protein n=1 Tax=Methylobacter sp. TaxID=2051955 RepID=UPI003DA53761
MNNDNTDLEKWLGGFGFDEETIGQESWDPGFEAERRIVHSRFGFYSKLFSRPEKFVKRFYHTVYPLTIADWALTANNKLYDGFCTITTRLDIRFQSSVKYATANWELLPDINRHIKAAYEGLVRDVIDRELLNLDDGAWIQSGLKDTEQKIAHAVNELLMVRDIQCRTFCTLKPAFEEFLDDAGLDGRFAQESVYLSVVKKNFEFREKQAQEKQRQEQELENQKLLHEQLQLQQLNREEELRRLKAIQDAENQQLLLKDEEKLQAERFIMEKRLHAEKIKHENALKEMAWRAEVEEQEKRQALHRETEQQNQINQLAHGARLKETALEAEIREFEKQQARWNEAKEKMHIESLKQQQRLQQMDLEAELMAQERQQRERSKVQQKLQTDKIEYESRLKGMQLEAEIKEQQKRFEATEKSDEYLRREIELLILEKQRAELMLAVNKPADKLLESPD